jgi:hypothetical protein
MLWDVLAGSDSSRLLGQSQDHDFDCAVPGRSELAGCNDDRHECFQVSCPGHLREAPVDVMFFHRLAADGYMG